MFTKITSSLCAFVALTALGGIGWAQPPSDSSDPLLTAPHQRADELHRAAKPLMDAGRLAEAEALLSEAFALKPSYDIAANYGAVLYSLGRHRDASNALRVALALLPTDLPQQKRDRFDKLFGTSRSHVAAVHVHCGSPGAQIWVDGEVVGTAPLDHEIYVDPGEHRFEARLGADRSIGVTRTFIRGDDKRIELGSVLSGNHSAPAPTAQPVLREEGDRGVSEGAIGTLAISLALFSSGLGMASHAAFELRPEYDELAERLDGRCGAPVSADDQAPCAELDSTRNQHNNLLVGGWVTFSIGTAGLAAGTIWAVIDSQRDEATGLGVMPMLSPTTQGVVLSGRF